MTVFHQDRKLRDNVFILQYKTESEMEVGQSYDLPVTVSTDILTLLRSSTNNTTNWGLNVQILELIGDSSGSNHHQVLRDSKASVGFYELSACLNLNCVAQNCLHGHWDSRV